MRELGITADDLADRTRVPRSAVGYLRFLYHDNDTLEHLSVALDWPGRHLRALWEILDAEVQGAEIACGCSFTLAGGETGPITAQCQFRRERHVPRGRAPSAGPFGGAAGSWPSGAAGTALPAE
jgi:hypothetical protein